MESRICVMESPTVSPQLADSFLAVLPFLLAPSSLLLSESVCKAPLASVRWLLLHDRTVGRCMDGYTGLPSHDLDQRLDEVNR